ncbi:MAG: glycerol-3-phosphate dehydrogenase [Candidatus Binatia bacterium]|nr:MAG: glycerol-3-phosphate dehydrogenase [Candidatus Binatia bacterium]
MANPPEEKSSRAPTAAGPTRRHEVAIVGAGIAGASLAYFLAREGLGDVVVLERESQPAYHASGRSAATLVELDPVPTVQKLKILGARFLREPPPGFSRGPVLERRGVLALFCEPAWSTLEREAHRLEDEGLRFSLLGPEEATARVDGVLDPGKFDGAVWLPEDGFLDVHELLTGYVRGARAAGVRFELGCEVRGILREGRRAVGVETNRGRILARWVVNAAGAWVGEIAREAGALPIEFVPYRRTLVVFRPPPPYDPRAWPLVWSEPHRLYFRPETTGILFCPMDETPERPCDAKPDEMALAEGLERLRELAPSLVPSHLGRRWAGLRTFAPDRVPVVGEDPWLHGFFWLAGQGGSGIETSGILGAVAADLLLRGSTTRFDADLLSPGRFLDSRRGRGGAPS